IRTLRLTGTTSSRGMQKIVSPATKRQMAWTRGVVSRTRLASSEVRLGLGGTPIVRSQRLRCPRVVLSFRAEKIIAGVPSRPGLETLSKGDRTHDFRGPVPFGGEFLKAR